MKGGLAANPRTAAPDTCQIVNLDGLCVKFLTQGLATGVVTVEDMRNGPSARLCVVQMIGKINMRPTKQG